MIYRELGRTGLKVSIVSYGASPLGAEFGQIDPAEGKRAVHYAIDHGINYFDVAPYYGRTLAEIRLGEASRLPLHSLQKQHESMKSRKARSKPARNTARSSLTSLALILADQVWRSSGFFILPWKCRMMASLYSLKKRSHSATDGVFGGQAPARPYSPQPNMHFMRTHWATMMRLGSIHL